VKKLWEGAVNIRDLARSLFLGFAVLLGATSAQAAWPDRPITIIVPWGAGGAADQLSRALAPMLEKDLKVPINVVLRPGGSGAVGHTALAQATPDGYTWGLATVEITMMHWQGLAQIQPKDFTIAAIINGDAGGLIVRSDSPYKTAKDLLSDIKAKPAKTFKASGTGQGGIWHLGLVGWLLAEKIDPATVPWVPNQGAAPSMQDLVAGGVDFVTASLPEGRALIDAGKARALAQMDTKRLALYPDVPTLKEAAGSDWSILTWRGVLGPAGIPDDIRTKMIAAVKAAFDSAEFQDFMKNRGFGTAWLPGDEGKAFIDKANTDFGRIMKEAGLAK
jgi:tripartite-type tricarboxylate transporter receptor subunit TctC